MATPDLHSPLPLRRGGTLRNRYMLAPLTNLQSHADGTLSDDEFHWLTLRARGGFGLVMTCASHVQAVGQGFPGQLGIWSDAHVPGLTRLAQALRAEGSLAAVQLHHAGMRSPRGLIGTQPVAPSDDAETGARIVTEGRSRTARACCARSSMASAPRAALTSGWACGCHRSVSACAWARCDNWRSS